MLLQSLISRWLPRYAARFDCGCRYQLKVQLLSADYLVLDEFRPEPVIIDQWSDAEWKEVRDVGSSCRSGSFSSVLVLTCSLDLTGDWVTAVPFSLSTQSHIGFL